MQAASYKKGLEDLLTAREKLRKNVGCPERDEGNQKLELVESCTGGLSAGLVVAKKEGGGKFGGKKGTIRIGRVGL